MIIKTLVVDGNKTKGFTVTAMLEDGALVDIKEGTEWVTLAQAARTRVQLRDDNVRLQRSLEEANVTIGELRQRLAEKPADVRVPLMHHEHQDIPTARTLDKLAPLDALQPAPSLSADNGDTYGVAELRDD